MRGGASCGEVPTRGDDLRADLLLGPRPLILQEEVAVFLARSRAAPICGTWPKSPATATASTAPYSPVPLYLIVAAAFIAATGLETPRKKAKAASA
jgi:hypothetical protein